ncbi:38154_t:CDS:1, partial [Gigaspora margarita]
IENGSTCCCYIQILFKTPTDETLELDALPSDTILNLKQKIQAINSSKFSSISFEGIELDDNVRLVDAGIKNGCTLCCFISIFVITLSGKTVIFRTSPFNTVEYVKHLIINTADRSIRLLFAGKGLENHRKLSDYNIQHG